MHQYQTRSKGSFLDAAFIKDAVDALGTSRRLLQFSYAFAYYLKADNSSTLIFVENQQYVEQPTEELSSLLEQSDIKAMDENELKAMKTKVNFNLKILFKNFKAVEVTTRLKKSCKTLLKHAYDGAKNNEWQYYQDLMGNLKIGTMER
jgi:hypothetical protein